MPLASAARRPPLRCVLWFNAVPLFPCSDAGKKSPRSESLAPSNRFRPRATPQHEVSLTPGLRSGSEGNAVEPDTERSGVRRAAVVVLDVRWIQAEVHNPVWNGQPDQDIVFTIGVVLRILLINTSLLPLSCLALRLRRPGQLHNPPLERTGPAV